MKYHSIAIGMVGLSMAVSAAMAEPQPPVTESLSVRVDRLEKMMNAQSNYQVQNNLQELQDELQTLRGKVDTLEFELGKLKSLQQQEYTDLDQRMKGSGMPSISGSSSNAAESTSTSASSGVTAVPPAPSASDAETKKYQSAYVMLTEQKYSAAIPAFQSYIQDYPNGQYIASAYYWLGETQTIANDLEEAKKAFKTVIEKYPHSPKVIDASLKLAMVYEDAGQYERALDLFKEVAKKYPNTPQAKLAHERIQQIENIDR